MKTEKKKIIENKSHVAYPSGRPALLFIYIDADIGFEFHSEVSLKTVILCISLWTRFLSKVVISLGCSFKKLQSSVMWGVGTVIVVLNLRADGTHLPSNLQLLQKHLTLRDKK